MKSRNLKQLGIIGAVALMAAMSSATPSQAWVRVGCFACGGAAFAAGAVAGAAIAHPYIPPAYVYGAPVYGAPVYGGPVYPPYATCPIAGPVPYYCQ
jgi:hypothetical protein